MAEKRISPRVPFRNVVRFGHEKPVSIFSYIVDLSDTGMFLKTVKVYKPGSRLFLEIDTEEETIEVEGVVAWAKRVPPNLLNVAKGGMGIKFIKIESKLIEYYNNKKSSLGY